MSSTNILRLLSDALKAGEPIDLGSSDALKVLPDVDNTGKLQIGDGSTDLDVQIFMGATSQYVLFDVSAGEFLVADIKFRDTIDSANGAVFASTNTVAYTDTSAKNLFIIPANANIITIVTDVTTAFNGTTPVLDIGKTGTGNHFINNLDVSSLGQTVTGYSILGDVGSSDLTVTATFAVGGGTPTQGQATVSFLWLRI